MQMVLSIENSQVDNFFRYDIIFLDIRENMCNLLRFFTTYIVERLEVRSIQ